MTPEENAFLAEICDRLDDQLPRLVFADWLDERGREGEAAAWRATAHRTPGYAANRPGNGSWYWLCPTGIGFPEHRLPLKVFDVMADPTSGWLSHIWYPIARAALLDLVAAWVKVEEERPKVCRVCGGEVWAERRLTARLPEQPCPECGGTAVVPPRHPR